MIYHTLTLLGIFALCLLCAAPAFIAICADRDGLAFLWIAIVFGSVWFYSAHTEYDVCEKGKVVSIGGCGRYGECKVKLESGTIGQTSYPLMGEVSEVCAHKTHPFAWSTK